MARKTKLDIVREAIEIRGHLPVPGPLGKTYRVRNITGTAKNGAWITDHLTSDLMGYMRIKSGAKDWMVEIAQGIIDRKDEIIAERERVLREAAGR